MKKTSVILYKDKLWQVKEIKIFDRQFYPESFLQFLYEAYIFYRLSNITNISIVSDVLKKLEFSIKNLTYEFFIKLHGLTEQFYTNWEYIFDHLQYFNNYDINTQILFDCAHIRKRGF